MAFHSTTDWDDVSMHAPMHPVPQLQGPFEESMTESVGDTVDPAIKPDPVARRAMLLERPVYERVCAGRWKQRPGEKYHPLWKISAQMSFGIHLLAEGLAKSEEEVMKILQTHVDDVDGFLEATTEDFDLAQSDVEERLRYLKLPLEHVEVFDRMLEDRAFRVSIVEGNEKIEHIVERTSESMRDALKDVQKGLQATNALAKYLDSVQNSWTTRTPGHDAVFVAMVGNVEGWHRAFTDLHQQGHQLGVCLVQLAGIVSEMQRRAGVASRKTLMIPHNEVHNSRPFTEITSKQSRTRRDVAQEPRSGRNSPHVPSKPLPMAPDSFIPSAQSTSRTSPRKPRSRQLSSTMSDLRKLQNPTTHEPQLTQRGDTTSNPRNQRSAPDLKQKKKTANRHDVNRNSGSEALASYSGLGLHPTTAPGPSPRPVATVQRTTSGLSSGAIIELPAHVPEAKPQDELPSRKQRRSFSLGLRNKDKPGDNRQSPLASNGVGSLLKSTLSPRLTSSPGSATVKSNDVSPALSAGRDSPNVGYFSSSLNSTPRGGTPGSGRTTPLPMTPIALKKSTDRNPTFTSHPPNMVMASSPPPRHAELMENSHTAARVPAIQAVPDLDSKHASVESTLGEPGPEVSDIDMMYYTEETPVFAELDSGSPAPQGPVELEGFVPESSRTMTFELEAPAQRAPNTGATGSPPWPRSPVSGTIRAQSDFFKLPPHQAGESVESVSDETRSTSHGKGRSAVPNFNPQRSFQLPPGGPPKDTGDPAFQEPWVRNGTQRRSFHPPPGSQKIGIEIPTPAAHEIGWQSPTLLQPRSFQLPSSNQQNDYTPTAPQEIGSQSPTLLQPRSFKLPSSIPQHDVKSAGPQEIGSQSPLMPRSFQLPPSNQQNKITPSAAQEDGPHGRVVPRSFQLPPSNQHNNIDSRAPQEIGTSSPVQPRSFQLPPGESQLGTNVILPAELGSQSPMQPRSFQLPLGNVDHDIEAKQNRKVPVDDIQINASQQEAREVSLPKKRSSRHQSKLIDHISSTPPGSPIHERPRSSLSELSSGANSARLSSYRASRDLAPPEEAPAPPGPGGRSMVTPDYAAAGAFEGERKQKRISGPSMDGFKKMFTSSSNNPSRANSVRVVEASESKHDDAGGHENGDLTTAGGSDVLWFKGMSREGVWVSGN